VVVESFRPTCIAIQKTENKVRSVGHSHEKFQLDNIHVAVDKYSKESSLAIVYAVAVVGLVSNTTNMQSAAVNTICNTKTKESVRLGTISKLFSAMTTAI
jgi:methylthioribose-1-phosphate isomerase